MPIAVRVRPQDEQSEFMSDEGCWILETWNDVSDPAVSIARARVLPGVTTKLHRLTNVAERYLIVAGKGVVRVGASVEQEVNPGDVVVIPPDTPQQITNTASTDLIFYCVCTPRFTPGCYQSMQ
jgi:mannose-6-phosphate isomerase-like protein (cupin superfamily)